MRMPETTTTTTTYYSFNMYDIQYNHGVRNTYSHIIAKQQSFRSFLAAAKSDFQTTADLLPV